MYDDADLHRNDGLHHTSIYIHTYTHTVIHTITFTFNEMDSGPYQHSSKAIRPAVGHGVFEHSKVRCSVRGLNDLVHTHRHIYTLKTYNTLGNGSEDA